MINLLQEADVAVIGGGLAAMEAALAVISENPEAKVVLLSKKPVGLSGASLVALSVHRYAPQEPGLRQEYGRSFLASSQGVGDPALLEILMDEGAAALERLEALGLPLESKVIPAADGRMYRYLSCCRPKYGRRLTEPMRKLLLAQPRVREEAGYMALELLMLEGAVCGVLAEKEGRFYVQPAKAVILASGGAGFVYENTSNTRDLTGDGYGLALRAGLALQDMEFVQFYPYRIHSPGRANIFPDVFEHGAVFLNEKGERFMAGFPKKEQENRDVLARQMFAQKEVIFDISGADQEYIKNECSAVYDLARKHHTQRFLMKPVAHFMMGGIPLQPEGASGLPGLYCCGEVTGGLHGANRIAGSALTECAVFGTRAGRAAARYAQDKVRNVGTETARRDQLAAQAARLVQDFCPPAGQEDTKPIIAALRQTMWKKASLIRSEASLKEAKAVVEALGAQLKSQRPASLRLWLEAGNLLLTAEAILNSALLRRESRGAHFREDYPAADPAMAGNVIYRQGRAEFIKRLF